jgi:hemerythrin
LTCVNDVPTPLQPEYRAIATTNPSSGRIKQMPYCQWSEKMSVGESRLDADHKTLIRLINQLHDDINSEVNATVVDEVLDSLINYTKFHFTREATVMRACGYPDTKFHFTREATVMRACGYPDT